MLDYFLIFKKPQIDISQQGIIAGFGGSSFDLFRGLVSVYCSKFAVLFKISYQRSQDIITMILLHIDLSIITFRRFSNIWNVLKYPDKVEVGQAACKIGL